jgi:signal peptidase I
MRQVYRFGARLWDQQPLRWFLTVSLAAFLGIAAGRTVIDSFGSVSVVDGQSMLPNYPPGVRVYTTPVTTPLQRGDVVLLDDGHKDYALKRIVGLPGETVELWRGYVFVNCRLIEEPYLPKHTFTFPDQRTDAFVFHLDNDHYLVLGDNRIASSDSRFYGPIRLQQIKSRVPMPPDAIRPHFLRFTLPAPGKRTIRPVS